MGARTQYNFSMRRTLVTLLVAAFAAACAPTPISLDDGAYVLRGPYIPPNAHWPRGRRVGVTATMYNCVRAQTDSTPDITASGMRCGDRDVAITPDGLVVSVRPRTVLPPGSIRVGVLGVSRDMLREFPFGTQVVVYGRTYIVGDTMAAYWRRRIDIPHPTYRGAMLHGVKRTIMEVHR